MRQIVVTLKALNQDIDHNLKVNKSNDLWKSFELKFEKVKNILDELESSEKTSVNFEEFKELMGMLEEAGWRKQKPKKVQQDLAKKQ